jgi:hypothetical protein
VPNADCVTGPSGGQCVPNTTTTTVAGATTTSTASTSTTTSSTTTIHASTTTTIGPTCANGGLPCGNPCGGACGGVCVYAQGSSCLYQHCGDTQQRVCVGPPQVHTNCTSDGKCSAGMACEGQGLVCGTINGQPALNTDCGTICPE